MRRVLAAKLDSVHGTTLLEPSPVLSVVVLEQDRCRRRIVTCLDCGAGLVVSDITESLLDRCEAVDEALYGAVPVVGDDPVDALFVRDLDDQQFSTRLHLHPKGVGDLTAPDPVALVFDPDGSTGVEGGQLHGDPVLEQLLRRLRLAVDAAEHGSGVLGLGFEVEDLLASSAESVEKLRLPAPRQTADDDDTPGSTDGFLQSPPSKGFVAAAEKRHVEVCQIEKPRHRSAAHAAAPTVQPDGTLWPCDVASAFYELVEPWADARKPALDGGGTARVGVRDADGRSFVVAEQRQVDGSGNVASSELDRAAHIEDRTIGCSEERVDVCR